MPQRDLPLRFGAAVFAVGMVASAATLHSPAWADAPDASRLEIPPIGHALDLGVATDNQRPLTGALGYRLLLAPTLQLGIELRGGAVDRSYIAGHPVDGGGYGEGRLAVQGTVLREGPLWLDLRFAAGARYQAGAEARPDNQLDAGDALDAAVGVLADAAIIANVEAGPYLTARVGVSVPVVVQVDPTPGLETTGFLTLLGVSVNVTEHVSLTADGQVGGVFGWEGDGNKVAAGAQLGLRWLFGADNRDWRAF